MLELKSSRDGTPSVIVRSRRYNLRVSTGKKTSGRPSAKDAAICVHAPLCCCYCCCRRHSRYSATNHVCKYPRAALTSFSCHLKTPTNFDRERGGDGTIQSCGMRLVRGRILRGGGVLLGKLPNTARSHGGCDHGNVFYNVSIMFSRENV